MQLIRYQPHSYLPNFNITDLREEMDRLFGAASPSSREIPLNLYQNQDAFVVRAQLPGFTKENLGIEIVDGTLTISATRRSITSSAASLAFSICRNKSAPIAFKPPTRMAS